MDTIRTRYKRVVSLLSATFFVTWYMVRTDLSLGELLLGHELESEDFASAVAMEIGAAKDHKTCLLVVRQGHHTVLPATHG